MPYQTYTPYGGSSPGERSPNGINSEYGGQVSPNGIPEPVTPPTSGHTSVIYANPAHYFTNTKPMTPKSQYSTSLSIRDQVLPSSVNHTFSGSLASPVETPISSTLSSSQASYLATPHTPFSSNVSSEGLPPSPSTSGSFSLGVSRHSIPGAGPLPGIPPIGHARSYSYNLVDLQPSLSRMSLSGTVASNSGPNHVGPQERGLRPRAYSSGLTSNIASFAGPAGSTMQSSPYQDTSSSFYSYAHPLSQPVSSDSIFAANNILNHRTQYSQPQNHSAIEDTFSVSGNALSGASGTPRMRLHRSMSSASSGSGGLPAIIGESSSSQLDESKTYGANSNSLASGNNISSKRLSLTQKRNSIPRQRRSSSGASSVSIELSSASVNNTGLGTDTASSNSSGAMRGAPNVSIDLASATDDQIYSLCKDQRGCRFLQRKLTESDTVGIRRVFDATHSHIVSLMMDPFGNYFCQKLFEYCSPGEVTQLLSVAAPSLPSIAVNQHGTRALQKLIDGISTPEQVDIIVRALDGHVVRLIRDLNGNHVIQKLLLDLDDRGSQFIYDAVCMSVVEIGSHRHGCCVLQRCLDYAHDFNRHKLVAHIVGQALVLVCDPFGNYVCQYVIDLGVQEYTNSLVEQFLGKIAALSVQKFSSNVVEKCLRSASPDLQRALVAEVMIPKTLNELLLDNYGNYVIQTALESSTSLDALTKQQLSLSVQSALASTRSPYGRRIMSKLKSW